MIYLLALNKILLDASSLSSLLILSNCFGRSSTNNFFATDWHSIVSQCFVTNVTNIIITIIWHHQENGIFINILSMDFFFLKNQISDNDNNYIQHKQILVHSLLVLNLLRLLSNDVIPFLLSFVDPNFSEPFIYAYGNLPCYNFFSFILQYCGEAFTFE